MKHLKQYMIEARQLGQGWTNVENNDYKGQMLAFDEPSKYGIDGGRISKLYIKDKKTDKDVIVYDRGWAVKPSSVKAKKYLDELVTLYN